MAESRAEGLPAYLERAMGILSREAPVQFSAVRQRLAELRAVVRVGTVAPFGICLAGGPPWVDRRSHGEIELSVADPALSALLVGELTIEEGIATGRLAARGTVDHLLAFLDALGLWLHGALRCPSLPRLHHDFLAIETGAQRTSAKG